MTQLTGKFLDNDEVPKIRDEMKYWGYVLQLLCW